MKLNFRHILPFILALAMMLPIFTACSSSGQSDVTTEPEVTTEPAPVEEPVTILENGVCDYVIVRSADANADEKKCMSNLRAAIKEHTGISLDVDEDFVYAGHEIKPIAHEILLGITNREESKKFSKELREKDFAITYENERVVIAGTSAEALNKAVDYFIEKYLDKDKKSITVYTNRVEIVRHNYRIGMVKLNDVDLNDYSIVYAKEDLLSQFAAENLAAYLRDITGCVLTVTSDKSDPVNNEILIGKTNRGGFDSNVKLAADEFILSANGSKIIMYADGYMVGGAAGELINGKILTAEVGSDVNVKIESNSTPIKFTFKEAKNAIIMIGDGMGQNHINSALREGMKEFYAAQMPNVGTAKTYSYSVTPLKSATYTDSAASATALSTGYKTINGYIGVNHLAKPVKNVRELAYEQGARTAVLTTDVITGATPGGFTAHTNSRNSTDEIQKQINELLKSGSLMIGEGKLDNNLVPREKETLAAISAEGSRFFMMLEEGYIDKHSHNNKYPEMVSTVKRYNDAIAYAMEFVLMHPDTVLIVTADHETGGVTKKSDGSFVFTSGNHTNTDVPLFAMGMGTEQLFTNLPCNNVNIPKFVAKIFGDQNFGDPNVK